MPNLIPILISGKQGSGKSTTSHALVQELEKDFSIFVYRFANPIYRMHNACLEVLTDLGIQNVPEKDGRLLQLLGTEWGRNVYGYDIWVNCALGFAEKCRRSISAASRDAVLIIDDMRFKNEMAAFATDGLYFRLEADREIRKGRTKSWRDTDTHQSEVDLDDMLLSFDDVYQSDGEQSPTEIAKAMADYLRELRSDP